MVGGLYRFLLRLILAVILGVGFYGLGQLGVRRYLPDDCVLRESFSFELVEGAEGSWEGFARGQSVVLRRLAAEELEPLGRRYAVGVASQRGYITLEVRCGGAVLADWTEAFAGVVSRYVAYRGQLEREAGMVGERPEDWLGAGELESFREAGAVYAASHRELTELEIAQYDLSLSCADLRDQLARGASQSPRGEFAAFLEGALESRVRADRELKSLGGEGHRLSQQLVDLERRVGEAEQEGQRVRLLREQREARRRWELVRRELVVRREMLTLRVAQEQWGAFEVEVRGRLARAEASLAANMARQEVLREARAGALGRLSRLKSVGGGAGGDEALWEGRQVARLIGPGGYRRQSVASVTQQAILGGVAMAGFLLGLLLPVFWSGARRGRGGCCELGTSDEEPGGELGRAGSQAAAIAAGAGRGSQASGGSDPEHWAEVIGQEAAGRGSASVVLSGVGCAEVSVRFTVTLATALVRRGVRVLLIEAERGEGGLSAVFDLPSEPGLAEWRVGRGEAGSMIHETILPGLAFMGAGGVLSGSLSAGEGGAVWSELRQAYGVLLFYGPHALAGAGESDWLLDGGDVVLGVARRESQGEVDLQGVREALAGREARWLGLATVV